MSEIKNKETPPSQVTTEISKPLYPSETTQNKTLKQVETVLAFLKSIPLSISSKKTDSLTKEKESIQTLSFSVQKTSPDTLNNILWKGWWSKSSKFKIEDIQHVADFKPESFERTTTDILTEVFRHKIITEILGSYYKLPENPTYLESQIFEIKKTLNKIAERWTQEKIKQYNWNRSEIPWISENTRILHGNIFKESHKYTIVIPWIHTTDEEFYEMFQSICHFAEQQESNTIGFNTFYTPNDKKNSFKHIFSKIEAVIESIKENYPDAQIVLASHSAWSIYSVKLLEKYKSNTNISWVNYSPAIDRGNVYAASLNTMFESLCGEHFDYHQYDGDYITFLSKDDDVIFKLNWKNRAIEWDHSSCFQDKRNERRFRAAFKLLFKDIKKT